MARDIQEKSLAGERPVEKPAVDTPRGTWAILLGYAVVLAGLWLYGYIELLVRR